jgi:hypothetical protein
VTKVGQLCALFSPLFSVFSLIFPCCVRLLIVGKKKLAKRKKIDNIGESGIFDKFDVSDGCVAIDEFDIVVLMCLQLRRQRADPTSEWLRFEQFRVAAAAVLPNLPFSDNHARRTTK